MGMLEDFRKLERLSLQRLNSIIRPTVNNLFYLALGLLGCSLIPKSTIPLKIAVGAFLIGQAFFIAPLYYTAITDKRIPYFAKVVPAGGTSMIFAWGSLMFAV